MVNHNKEIKMSDIIKTKFKIIDILQVPDC
jgi:hypothetical protein